MEYQKDADFKEVHIIFRRIPYKNTQAFKDSHWSDQALGNQMEQGKIFEI